MLVVDHDGGEVGVRPYRVHSPIASCCGARRGSRRGSGGGEAGAVADGDQQDGGGPDADAGHRGQDRGKRVCLQQGIDLGFQDPSLFVDGSQRTGQGRDHDVEGAGPGHDDGLLVEGIEDVVDQFHPPCRNPGRRPPPAPSAAEPRSPDPNETPWLAPDPKSQGSRRILSRPASAQVGRDPAAAVGQMSRKRPGGSVTCWAEWLQLADLDQWPFDCFRLMPVDAAGSPREIPGADRCG